MNKSLILIGIAAVTLIVGLGIQSIDLQPSLRQDLHEPIPVPYVNLTRYLGAWYEQSTIPFYFEKGCSHTVANYSMNSDGKSVKVFNSCIKNGRLTNSTGKAIPEDDTGAKLKVEFVQTLDIGGQYWVVRLGTNYDYVVVSNPTYRNLWILYREPKMPESLYQFIYNDLKKDNYPVEKLVRTEQ